MKTGLPPLNWLKTFEVAARLLNFSAAGRELNMTQSAVSQQIRLLEHHLGEPLFSRKHRRVSLTNRGMAYLPVVQNAINGLQRITTELFSPVSAGALTLEVNMAFAWTWLAPKLSNFCSRYPGIRLEITHSNWDRDINESTADLIIRHGSGKWPGFISQPLIEPALKPYCASYLSRLMKNPMDLLSLSLIEIMGNRQGWKDWFQHAGIDDSVSLKHSVDSAAMAMGMAQSGVGVFLYYEDLISSTDLKNHLQAPFDISIATDDNYHLAYSENIPLSKPATTFIEWITGELP